MVAITGGGGSAVRVVSNLRDLAHLYRGFFMDLGGLCGTGRHGELSSQLPRASSLQCMQELLRRDKRVAVIQGTPMRASALAGIAKRAGVPEGVSAWTSGEFIYRSFVGTVADSAELSEDQSLVHWPSVDLGLPGCDLQRPRRVFELSSLAKPRRWAELSQRGQPPLSSLEKLGAVKRVSGVEEADICYWDAHEGDDLGAFVEAAIELCIEFKVPLLHASRSASAARALIGAAAKGTPEAAAASLDRMGGRSLSAGKLDGSAYGLGWANQFAPRDVLLVTHDLGDVVEAAAHGVDTLLLMGTRAESQLSAFKHTKAQEAAGKRRLMSVSQRVAEDSPGMLHAASNPFFSVFQLPALLAEANRKNAEHRARRERASAAAADSTSVAATPGVPPIETTAFDSLEALQDWCRYAGVPVPTVLLNNLRWDDTEVHAKPPHRPRASSTATAPSGDVPRRRKIAEASNSDAAPACTRSQAAAAAIPGKAPEVESVDDLLQKLTGQGGEK